MTMSIIGKTIDNYQIVAEISPGVLGPVCLAKHLDHGTRVVIRHIPLAPYSLSTRAQLKSRIRRAAYSHMQLMHPGLLRVLGLLTQDEALWLVTEHIAGQNLRDLLQRHGLPEAEQVLYICRQALKALDYMHLLNHADESDTRLKGLVHRDIKPSNMIIENNGRLRLIDYGLVSLPTSWSFSRVGFEPGTIEYMAPERLRGGVADARTDIYSLGVTIYELLTGLHPFERRERRMPGEGVSLSFDVVPPPLHEVRKDVSPELSEILMRAVSRFAIDRYATAGEFLKAIDDFDAGDRQEMERKSSGGNPFPGVLDRDGSAGY